MGFLKFIDDHPYLSAAIWCAILVLWIALEDIDNPRHAEVSK